ncbi:P-loop containing nucleoside triphosphate hydrolase protein [Schizopora paradoxa]|uniref:p-loop containing nucleoside triphosphate hydrolase protein n=1 Tax=Schizopora paradoxa TaxID=27342 RepID=A0A0H2R3C5_9AGAM|nr:P-loop containing nucleoside triphosphate hydrolase protein [Schizopora paradoxa]
MLRESVSSLKILISNLTYNFGQIADVLKTLQDVYGEKEPKSQMRNGDLSYPRIDDRWETKPTGMEIEFCDVSFKYPGTKRFALQNVSFKIKPGQMVAIVGVNGSGKSTITKLFNRLHDVTEGQVLIDGLPITSYKMKEVQQTIAILRQNHSEYPFSLRLNVELGAPNHSGITDEEIHEAIKAGGAAAFIKKLPNGFETVLDPIDLTETFTYGAFDHEVFDKLDDMLQEKTRSSSISGGESQRLAASRTFMRIMKNDIRLIIADEPTSALDATGEMAVFKRLREQRGDKTVVFITHRFGHLTKHADLILVMKDGHLVESGTHDELVSEDGEYNKLFQVQAQAFTTD